MIQNLSGWPWRPALPLAAIRWGWSYLRAVFGDDAYDKYLQHWREHHADDESQPLDRKTFFRRRQDEQWNDIRRCC